MCLPSRVLPHHPCGVLLASLWYTSLDCPFDPQSKDSRRKVSGKCKEGHGSVKDCKEWQGILWTALPFLK